MSPRVLAVLSFLVSSAVAGFGGALDGAEALHVLSPITHNNLTIFPVVGGIGHDTSRFLTLDEGVRAGTVIVTERGSLPGLIRRGQPINRGSGAEVNQLVLVNNSDRPLLLLAGEIVTGGKQDRIIGADRLVPPKSDPIDLSVFCVEPGRWVARSEQFKSMNSLMAQPSVRMPAMAKRDQREVWNSVASARQAVTVASGGNDTSFTTSYAATAASQPVQATIDKVANDYDNLLQELRETDAKGVVVAINGQLVWADIFASNDLLMRYWHKLVRSYAAESLSTVAQKGQVDQNSAQAFLDRRSGSREVIETDEGVFRRAEISGEGYKVFALTALLPKMNFDVHIAKMTCDKDPDTKPWQGMIVR